MNFKVYLISIFLLFLILIILQPLTAATRLSQQNGNWNNIATWGGILPVANDDIIISSGTTVYLNTSLPANSSFNSLVIEEGGSLIVGSDGVMLRLKGKLVNNGVLDLWNSINYQADIWLYGPATWSGEGRWNLSDINVQANSLDLAAGLTLTLNGSITAFAGSSFNKVNRYLDITLNIKGELNTSIPGLSDFYYGNIIIDKTSNTASFSPSTAANIINLLGNLTLVKPTDRLVVTANNTLRLQGGVAGDGVISGSTTGSLVVDNLNAPAINPLRILAGTSFRDFIVNRSEGVVLLNGFVVRESLQLNNSCVLTLPSQTLTLGVNGTNPTAGTLSGNGAFISSGTSSMSIRGKDTGLVVLRFDQATDDNHRLTNLTIDRIAGKAGIEAGNIIINGRLDVTDKNRFSIGAGTLILNSAPRFSGSGCLSGSENARLSIDGDGSTDYALTFDQSSRFGNTLKSYVQSRSAAITLTNKLNIIEKVSLTGNSSVLISDGNLTLLSSPDGNAGVAPLLDNADVRGDVNVQVYVSGDNKNMKYRGYRSLSSPLNDDLLGPGRKKSLEQLKDYIIITGPGGVSNGFDQGGSSQPFAQTLVFYNPLSDPVTTAFTPVTTIFQSLSPGTGLLAFYRGSQQGTYSLNYNKLNPPYSPPEATTVVYKGPINKFNLPSIILRTNNDTTDSHRGYNLIGNPYPSAIDWTRVGKSSGVNDEVIILKPGGGAATYLNGTSNNGGSPVIQTGQGFYVRTNADGNTVSFTEQSKTVTSPARFLASPLIEENADQGGIAKVSDMKSARQLVRLNLSNDVDTDETTIVFEGDRNPGADFNDAMYFSGSSVNLASLSSNGKKLAINFMPDLQHTEEVRLSVNAVNTGSYSLNFTEVPGQPLTLFLKDAFYNDQLTEIKKNDSYCFSIDKTDPRAFGDKRFTLIFKSDEPARSDTSDRIKAYPNPVSHKLYFDLRPFDDTSVQVLIFDMRGERKQRSEIRLSEEHAVDVSQLVPGVYIARLRTSDKGKSMGDILFIKQ